MFGRLTYGADTIRYEVCFLASRQTLAIVVFPDCRVLVRAPLGCSKALIAERVQKRAPWITRQLAEFERYRPRTPARQYINGESHLYLGRQYRLKISAGPVAAVKLTRGQFLVTVPDVRDPEQIRRILERWYLVRARAVFAEILLHKLSIFKGVQQPRLIVRAMRTRWGSLSDTGAMTLNTSLIRAPRSCIEYVVVHELCHVRNRNHDARFFSQLREVMPDWERRKQKLESSLL